MLLSFKVHKPSEFLFNYLTDMQLFVSVHPVIYRIDHLGDNHFKVFERLMLGLIPYSFTYKAFVESDQSQNTVTINANVMQMAKIKMHFQIQEQEGNCNVNEKITFTSVLPIKGIMQRIFKMQHKLLFENIDKI